MGREFPFFLLLPFSAACKGDEPTIGQQKVNICAEFEMNMVFNPVSTTTVISITLLHPRRCSVYLPLPAWRHRQKVCGVYHTQLCVCERDHVIRSYMDYALRKLFLDLFWKGWNWHKYSGKMWKLLWWVGAMSIVSLPLTNAI